MNYLLHTLSSCILERCTGGCITGILPLIPLLVGSAELQSGITNTSYLSSHVLLPPITSHKQCKKQKQIKQIVLEVIF